MKQLTFVNLLLFITLSLHSQNSKVVRYFDSSWQAVQKDSALFYTEFIKQGDLYYCSSYWVKSGKLNCKSTFKDTLFSQPVGLLKRYYETGQTEDSMYYHPNGKIKEIYHYYASGELWAHCIYAKNGEAALSEGYTKDGKPLKNFIYFQEAEFPGGNSGWIEYITSTLKNNIPAKNGAPKGTYKVIIKFYVDKNGKPVEVKAETRYGYGMEEEAIRVITKSPKWSPLILLGEKQKAYRRQPITFVVGE
jgi:antitoxin component YwqK of YwqJK toxin-antitoxin module